MPNWAWFLLGVVTGLLWFGGLVILIWWRTVSREPAEPPAPTTTVDHIIVRDIGTLTYSRRN